MLGSALVPTLASAGHEVFPTDIRLSDENRWRGPGREVADMGYLDVRSRDQIAEWMERVRPDIVMHLAAETDVDLCEAEPDHAYQTNALGTKHVALACQRADRPMVYI